jgi:hypothetical protein
MNNKKSISHDEQEVLTPEQYADRLQIGRSTLFSWLAQGVLIEGEHYFRVGRILRFIWNCDVLIKISSSQHTERPRPVPSVRTNGKHPFNWDY